MNYAGCKRKFNVEGYLAYVNKLVGGMKKRKSDTLTSLVTKHLKSMDSVEDKTES